MSFEFCTNSLKCWNTIYKYLLCAMPFRDHVQLSLKNAHRQIENALMTRTSDTIGTTTAYLGNFLRISGAFLIILLLQFAANTSSPEDLSVKYWKVLIWREGPRTTATPFMAVIASELCENPCPLRFIGMQIITLNVFIV